MNYINGNTVQKETQEFNFQELVSSPIVQAVDTKLLNAIEGFLKSVSITKKGSNRQTVKYGDKSTTVYQYTGRELTKAQNIRNYEDRLNAYLELAAIVRIFVAPASLRMDENLDPIMHIEQISSARMAEEIATIKYLVEKNRF